MVKILCREIKNESFTSCLLSFLAINGNNVPFRLFVIACLL